MFSLALQLADRSVEMIPPRSRGTEISGLAPKKVFLGARRAPPQGVGIMQKPPTVTAGISKPNVSFSGS